METTATLGGAIVLYGSDAAFVDVVVDALPGDLRATVLLAGDFPAGALERRGLLAAASSDPEDGASESRRCYHISMDALEAELEPFGDRVIAIVYGQRDTYDLTVAHAVKRSGGTVIAILAPDAKPDRATSAFVDLFLPPAELPRALSDMLEDPLVKNSSGDEEQLRTFLRQVRQRTGIDFAQYKMATIRRRLQRLMIAANAPTLGDFQRHLQQHPAEFQRLVHEFLIKVTDFFRDDQLFEYLRSDVLPELVSRAREENRELRIWSAGCATGEEAYSIAILLAELLGSDETPPVKIFATDLDESAIAFARHGVYPRSALGAMPPEWIERYFLRTPRGFEVRKRIRSMTVFGQHDLGQRAPFPRTDLILCRNVLIYFTRELQQRTLQLFAFSLRESGYLVLGKSETVSPAAEYFRPINSPYRIFQRYGDRVLIPQPRTREPYALVRDRSESDLRAVPDGRARPGLDGARSNLFERFGTSVFSGSTGYVVVDRRYDVVAINAAGRRLLGIVGLGVGEDLIHLVQGSAALTLRASLDRALGGEEDTREIDMTDAPLAARRSVRVTVYPERNADGILPNGNAIVRIEDVSETSLSLEETVRTVRERDETIAQLGAVVRRADSARDAFASANQELSTANVELRSANEHLLISIEEAESSAEEIETLNEEMQATNEELETLNEELQASIEELNTTNDELHVRGLELQAAIEERDHAIERTGHGAGDFATLFAELPIALVRYLPDGTLDAMSDLYLALLERYGDPLPLTAASETSRPDPLGRASRGESFVETWSLSAEEGAASFELRSRKLFTDGRGSILALIEVPG